MGDLVDLGVIATPASIAAAVTTTTTKAAEAAASAAAAAATGAPYALLAKNPDLLVVGAVTGDPMTSAAVVWPDTKPGVLTITARHASGAVTAYNITHVDGATTTTYTQPAITRATSGAVTNVPQIVVS